MIPHRADELALAVDHLAAQADGETLGEMVIQSGESLFAVGVAGAGSDYQALIQAYRDLAAQELQEKKNTKDAA